MSIVCVVLAFLSHLFLVQTQDEGVWLQTILEDTDGLLQVAANQHHHRYLSQQSAADTQPSGSRGNSQQHHTNQTTKTMLAEEYSNDEAAEIEANNTTPTTTLLAEEYLKAGEQLVSHPIGELAVMFIDAVHDVSVWVNQAVVIDREITADSNDTVKSACESELQFIMGPWMDMVNTYHSCGDGISDAVACAEITKCLIAKEVGKTISHAMFATVLEMEEVLVMEYIPPLNTIFREESEWTDFVCPYLDLEAELSLMQMSSTAGSKLASAMATVLHVQHTVSAMSSTHMNSTLSSFSGLWQEPCHHLGCNADSFHDVLHHLHGHAVTLLEEGAPPAVMHAHVKSTRRAVRTVMASVHAHVKDANHAHVTGHEIPDIHPVVLIESKSSGTDNYNEHLSRMGGAVDGANRVLIQKYEREHVDEGSEEELAEGAVHESRDLVVESSEEMFGSPGDVWWGPIRVVFSPRRRRRVWEGPMVDWSTKVFKPIGTVLKTAPTTGQGPKKSPKQTAREVLKFTRALSHCLGISVYSTRGWRMSVPAPALPHYPSVAFLSVGYKYRAYAYNPKTKQFEKQIDYMSDDNSYQIARSMFQKLVGGSDYCAPDDAKRYLDISAAIGVPEGNCLSSKGCTVIGVGASTSYPNHKINNWATIPTPYCYPPKFDYLMAGYTSVAILPMKVPEMGPFQDFPATSAFMFVGVDVSASCCKASIGPLKQVSCGWES